MIREGVYSTDRYSMVVLFYGVLWVKNKIKGKFKNKVKIKT
jgi:hypothetical protein